MTMKNIFYRHKNEVKYLATKEPSFIHYNHYYVGTKPIIRGQLIRQTWVRNDVISTVMLIIEERAKNGETKEIRTQRNPFVFLHLWIFHKETTKNKMLIIYTTLK